MKVIFEVLDRKEMKWFIHEGFEIPVLPREGETVIWDEQTMTVARVVHDLDAARITVRIK